MNDVTIDLQLVGSLSFSDVPSTTWEDLSVLALDNAHNFAALVHVTTTVGTGIDRRSHTYGISLARFCAAVVANLKEELKAE